MQNAIAPFWILNIKRALAFFLPAYEMVSGSAAVKPRTLATLVALARQKFFSGQIPPPAVTWAAVVLRRTLSIPRQFERGVAIIVLEASLKSETPELPILAVGVAGPALRLLIQAGEPIARQLPPARVMLRNASLLSFIKSARAPFIGSIGAVPAFMAFSRLRSPILPLCSPAVRILRSLLRQQQKRRISRAFSQTIHLFYRFFN